MTKMSDCDISQGMINRLIAERFQQFIEDCFSDCFEEDVRFTLVGRVVKKDEIIILTSTEDRADISRVGELIVRWEEENLK